MNKRNLLALFSIFVLLSTNTQAQEACQPSTFDHPIEVIERYLQDCPESRGAMDQPEAGDMDQHLAFWRQRAESFETLATTSTNSAVSGVAFNLFRRAQIAASDLEALMNKNLLCDAARYKKVSWMLQGNAKLPRITENQKCVALAGNAIPETALHFALEGCSGEQCAKTWNELKPLLTEYNMAFLYAHWLSKRTVADVYEQVAQKYADWETFSFNSKAMLPWDMAFTELVNPGKFSEEPDDGFIAPPNTQYFLFHPGIGYAINDNEPEGERDSAALYVEIGFNRWRENDGIDLGLGRLSGASIIGVIADTIATEEVGYGLMLTFDNVYQVSMNKHSGDYSLMLGFNLYNLWEEKYKAEVIKWKNQLNSAF